MFDKDNSGSNISELRFNSVTGELEFDNSPKKEKKQQKVIEEPVSGRFVEPLPFWFYLLFFGLFGFFLFVCVRWFLTLF